MAAARAHQLLCSSIPSALWTGNTTTAPLYNLRTRPQKWYSHSPLPGLSETDPELLISMPSNVSSSAVTGRTLKPQIAQNTGTGPDLLSSH